MCDYVRNIALSGLSIYDYIASENHQLYIPTPVLQQLLSNALLGRSLAGYALRTRSRIVKEMICTTLGYPVPKSFQRSHPRFPGQNFDVYTQKRLNVQIWNEQVDARRRYVFLRVNQNDIITAVKIITGEELAGYDRTGTLTRKYQASMQSYGRNICSQNDTITVQNWIVNGGGNLTEANPNSFPQPEQLLSITEVYQRLLPLIGKSIDYIDAVQERNRGAGLHAMICQNLGYSIYEDDGNYPDIANQLLEIKLQTSPTIDLGLHSPEDGDIIFENTNFHSSDIRYAIFDGEVRENEVYLKNLYLVTGEEFSSFFPLFQGRVINAKIQLPLPINFFD